MSYNTPKPSAKVGASLDTLAQLFIDAKNPTQNELEKLKKRAKSKTISAVFSAKLLHLKSPLQKSYFTSLNCANILQVRDGKLISRYCNHRWCLVCNRIRTAKLIKGYYKPLTDLENKYFVTLTIPNVKARDLKKTIEVMYSSFRKITRNILLNYGTKLTGIRKLECTYNPERKDYHPHYHVIVSGYSEANLLMSLWLSQFPDAREKAQDIREANDNSVMELFKYFSKLLPSKKDKNRDIRDIEVSKLDIIFQAVKGKRVFQPIGLKKTISEDIDDLEGVIYADLREESNWIFSTCDWYDTETGEGLTGYEPSQETKMLIEKVK
jgi:hypothetical protein